MGLVNTAKALPECPDSATFFSFFPPVPALKGSKGGFCYVVLLKFASLFLRPPPAYNLRSREHTGTPHSLRKKCYFSGWAVASIFLTVIKSIRFFVTYPLPRKKKKKKLRWIRDQSSYFPGWSLLLLFLSKLKTLLPIFLFSFPVLFFSFLPFP